ncbi:MAG: transglutaminase-like domain-containing protein [Flavobacteriales bacterium]
MLHPEISALISLIEDPDEGIYTQVRAELKSRGEQIIPQLEQYWELHEFGPLFHKRVEELISSIQYESVYNRLRDWRNSPEQDLLEGAIILNRYQYPGFDETELRRSVSRLRQDIWLELNDNLTALETVRVFNHMLFQLHGFHGNQEVHSSPQDHFLTDLLSTKCGNPTSLGMLYCLLAKTLDVPVYGVNLPSHFLLCFMDYTPGLEDFLPPLEDSEVLFYVDPFTQGAVLTRDDIDDYLRNHRLNPEERFYRPCSSLSVIIRLMNSLIHSYIALNRDDKVRELRTLQSILLERMD